MAGASVEQNWQTILESIRRAGCTWGDGTGEVSVIVASKFQPLERLRAVHRLGLRHFGENYLQEAQQKRELLSDLDIDWHFFGRIQSNKVKDLVGRFSLIHSVGRTKILSAIQTRARNLGIEQSVLLQAHLYDEATKDGLSQEEIKSILLESNQYPNVKFCGLMAFPPLTDDEGVARDQFRKAKLFFDELKAKFAGEDWTILSMGTSADYYAALLEGSNCLRLGEVLLGQRERGESL